MLLTRALGRSWVHACQARVLRTGPRTPTHMSSERIRRTDDPCIVEMQRMLRGTTDVLSLAQGVVHWKPPQDALDAAVHFLNTDPRAHSYGADDGCVVAVAWLRVGALVCSAAAGYEGINSLRGG
jgi:hypothetical protein